MVILAAGFALLAVVLALPPRGDGLSRLEARSGSSSWLRRLARGRPGAPAVALRAAGAVAAGGAVWVLGGAAWAAVAGLVTAAVAYLGLGFLETGRARRRAEAIAVDLPEALDLLAATLGAGLPLRAAARAVADAMGGPVGEVLDGVARRIELGADERAAWLAVAGEPHVGAVARDIARSVRSGTALGDVLARYAADARRERHALLEARAKAVGVRSVLPLMVCFLPAFLLVGVVPIVAGLVIRLLG